ncbi:MAG: hypothetical protein NDI81_10560 [Desulfobacula sp.]|nr:hypothetical protein [Desulfobacula sp.]
MENVSHIQPFEKMLPWDFVPPAAGRGKKREKKSAAKPRKYFSILSQLVDDTHLSLVTKKSPFRLCVYREKEEVLMDIVTLDKTKKINRLYNRTITHNDMETLGRQILNGMGLILDYTV